MRPPTPRPAVNLFSLSAFWFAWEVHWAALLGAALQGQIARFIPSEHIGAASALLGGAGAVFSILSQYGFGRLSDRAGRRMPFIVAGTLCDIAALFAFAVAPSFALVLIAYVGVQVALNAACGPYQALMPDRVAMSARGKASAVMGLLRLSGTAVGLFLAKLFVHQPGPGVSPAMFTAGLVHLAIAVSALLLVLWATRFSDTEGALPATEAKISSVGGFGAPDRRGAGPLPLDTSKSVTTARRSRGGHAPRSMPTAAAALWL